MSSIYYCLTFTNECSDCILNTFKTLLSTDPGILYKNAIWSFLGHRCVENNEWRGIHDDYQTAPNLNISMGCTLAQLMICYIREVKTCIKCGAVRFVRRQYLRSCLLTYNLPTSTLFARQLETSLFFSLSILRNGTSNGVKTPSAINQSFRLDKNYIMLKYLQLKEYASRPANLQPLSGRKRCDFTVLQQRKEFTLLPTMVT